MFDLHKTFTLKQSYRHENWGRQDNYNQMRMYSATGFYA